MSLGRRQGSSAATSFLSCPATWRPQPICTGHSINSLAQGRKRNEQAVSVSVQGIQRNPPIGVRCWRLDSWLPRRQWKFYCSPQWGIEINIPVCTKGSEEPLHTVHDWADLF